MLSKKLTVLVVDDDIHALRIMWRTLQLEGYRVLTATNGEDALKLFESDFPDLVLLDIMMPGLDGYSVCQRLREFSRVPIIMLTARGNRQEKVNGLEAGADDYVTKPFAAREVLARIKAVLRRCQFNGAPPRPAIFKSGNIEVNLARRHVAISGKEINLTPVEYHLMEELLINRGKVLTHAELLHKIWGPAYTGESEYLHVYIGRLRTKLQTDAITTIAGVGYQFN